MKRREGLYGTYVDVVRIRGSYKKGWLFEVVRLIGEMLMSRMISSIFQQVDYGRILLYL